MKGVGRLVKNELIKIFGQLSWKIITILILVFSLLSPLLTSLLGSFVYTVGNDFYREMYNESADGTIEKEYYGTLADVEEFFSDNGITYEDWRYEEYFVQYQDLSVSLKAYELVKNGKGAAEVFDWFYTDEVTHEYDPDGNLKAMYFDGLTGESMEITAEIAAEEYEIDKAQLDELKDTIINGTVKSYAEGYVDSIKQSIAEYEGYLAEAKAAYEADETKYSDYRAWEYNVYAYKTSLAIWEKLVNAPREDEAWLLSTAKCTFYYTDMGPDLVAVSEEDFTTDNDLVREFGTYEYYSELLDKRFYDNIAALDILRYSAENGKPLPSLNQESVRANMFSEVSGSASTILLLCIILAASIVANEHMSGTVRLLLIRPRARWKILLSKLLAVVVYGIGMFAASNILTLVMTLIINGTGDLFVPMLVYRHGAVKEVSPIIYIVVKTLIDSLPNLLIMMFAFFLSVAVRKVVFSVAIPVMVTMFGSIASAVTLMFVHTNSIIKWTILPYFTMEGYTTHVVERTMGNALYDFVSWGFETEIGVILLLAHIAIFTALSFIVFKRQQIKS